MLTDKTGKTSSSPASAPEINVVADDGATIISLSGRWTSLTVARVDNQMRKLESGLADKMQAPVVKVDMGDISGLDTAGAWLIERLRVALSKQQIRVHIDNIRPSWTPLLEEVGAAVERYQLPEKHRRPFFAIALLDKLGRFMYAARDDFLMSMHILGATIRGSQMKSGRGNGISYAAIVNQIDRMGVGAIPVVLLMSTIIGAIIAQQGAFQLRYFGAEIFVVDLVGILVLREIGVLLTAIMIAGRSGSAITAEIGSMKMREETDALTVIGLNPVGVLVFPRLVALVIVLPMLTIIADLAALAGAGFVAWAYSGIPPEAFMSRLRDAIVTSTYLAGLIKAPFMAMIIGIMASVEGMKVKGSAESLGRRVTSSVVKSIFVVIVVDGLFAIFYAAIEF
ncbi:MlaE family lipid ABC transporter permease subunit [Pseudochrobactrum sp. Wa41.01b-1]|uniref:ABC transporter permease n=1 Tax=Pseudochrobactrum sp. Wa41.01b-1 TaxID=2864102 RepID=UPI001C6898CB|nr:ABC transporter permease [Pseudochrobactrum sp. Wa41.01b-1]QYM73043.1 MlaE family lipid ABC transporter permease subunit [Pseudochrobactrum sp. Wa41.01b-1]